MTTMEPNTKSALQASPADSSIPLDTSVTLPATPVPVPGEPNLYQIPSGLHATYRALQWPLQVLLAGTVSILYSIWNGGLSWEKIVWEPLRILRQGLHVARAARLLLQLTTMYIASYAVLQELIARPSRVSTRKLLSEYHLPSSLSRYRNVSGTAVHWLQYDAPATSMRNSPSLRVLYFNHGFGASSLSWLPAMAPLVDSLQCNVGLGHDAMGFGFTERTQDAYTYSSQGSAAIGLELLKEHSGDDTRYFLMGHSMGAITTLHMALGLPKDAVKKIILVAPALGIRRPTKGGKMSSPKTTWSPASCFLDAPASYLLRRAVGRPNFWRKGLSFAWGDPKRLTNTDVLRFQWPSIGKGWEKGLLQFARSQRSEISDEELLSRVLTLPNTSVHVIVGGSDHVVSTSRVRDFLAGFASVSVTELPTLGHDPFEEDTATFVNTVTKLLEDS